jgi:acyl carrier protein
VSRPGALSRDVVVEMLAAFGDRQPDAVGDAIGSLELTWLITQVEQRYQVTLEPTDDQLERMTTVSAAVATLQDLLTSAAHG